EHPTECDTVDGSGMDAEPNDPAGIWIHHDQDPYGPKIYRRMKSMRCLIEVTLLHAAFASSIGCVASVSFMRTILITSFVSNALEYFDHTGWATAFLPHPNHNRVVKVLHSRPVTFNR